jgi:hypothetical protein
MWSITDRRCDLRKLFYMRICVARDIYGLLNARGVGAEFASQFACGVGEEIELFAELIPAKPQRY